MPLTCATRGHDTGQGHVVASLPENCSHRVWNILVELDRGHGYAAGMGTMVSRARSAA